MADRKKVIEGLECCIANAHNNCPYKSTDKGIDKVTSCTTYLMTDALALLKEQEPIAPKMLDTAVPTSKTAVRFVKTYWCGACGEAINQSDVYCRKCGRAVKWDE